MEDRAGHGSDRLDELRGVLEDSDSIRDELLTEDELRALGTIVTLVGPAGDYPLALDRLESLSRHRTSPRRPRWLLLSVLPAQPDLDLPERATVWVSDEYRAQFIKVFEDYLEASGPAGNPRNNELVANIAQIRRTILADLWQSDGPPPSVGNVWWEVWLRPSSNGPELLKTFAEGIPAVISPRVLHLIDRDVMWLEATWDQLQVLPFTAVPVAEIRRPEFIDSLEDLTLDEQVEYIDDLLERLDPAGLGAPVVCHLDTGVARTHVLLEQSLAGQDLHTVLGTSGFDTDGHGTKMAGIALLGDLLEQVTSTEPVVLRHRLESVRILPNKSETPHQPRTYGDVTAQAVTLPEITAPTSRRVFCMPVSATGDAPTTPGQPTLWSATIDALAVGADVVSNGDELELLSAPDPERTRLLVLSAGNIDQYEADHLAVSDLAVISDPGQAWNAVTVGAHTERVDPPTDPAYTGWDVLSEHGELSPYSRTSLLFGNSPWPIKPDIVMEGGNVLHDGASLFEPGLPVLSTSTTGHTNDQAITSAHATSAATASAARLAAIAMATYPDYWPETIRGLLVHGAEWTPAMRQAIIAAGQSGLKAQQNMLRRYGWGVPTEERVLYSTEQAVTLVIQDEFTPFDEDYRVPTFRLHDLPWPTGVLQDLGAADVQLRVTLSYFIEPTASRRGWRRRYLYPSHGLRFELQDPLETGAQFVQRINQEAATEEAGARPGGGQVKWEIGPRQRNLGSLHQDIWSTSGVELAQSGRLAVYPVGGWWKNNKAKSRVDQPVRYALMVSLKTATADVDLYTPVANEIRVATPIEI